MIDIIMNLLGIGKSEPKMISSPPSEPITPQEAFRLNVQDVLTIKGRGILAAGKIESGLAQVGQKVLIKNFGNTIPAQIIGIEAFRKQLQKAEVGMNVGFILSGVSKDQIEKNAYIESDL